VIARDPAPVRIALALLRVYKLAFSPLFAGSCRYLPSCSDYAAEAIRTHGLNRGTLLAARRLSRCHPWGGSGLDPVPGRDLLRAQGRAVRQPRRVVGR
jgi:putative membrane protein insertion efficiency factor